MPGRARSRREKKNYRIKKKCLTTRPKKAYTFLHNGGLRGEHALASPTPSWIITRLSPYGTIYFRHFILHQISTVARRLINWRRRATVSPYIHMRTVKGKDAAHFALELGLLNDGESATRSKIRTRKGPPKADPGRSARLGRSCSERLRSNACQASSLVTRRIDGLIRGPHRSASRPYAARLGEIDVCIQTIPGCQSALNSFQGTASKNFQFVSLISIVFCVA